MRPRAESPSLNAPLNERLAREFAKLGQAAFNIATLLQGALVAPAAPVPPSLLPPGEPAPSASWLNVLDLVNEFMLSRAKKGASDRYLQKLRTCLKNFASARGRIPVDQVAAPQIEKWLWDNGWRAITMRKNLGDVRTMFNYAVRRGYLARSPAAAVEAPRPDPPDEYEVHTNDQVRHVLESARRFNLDICRHLAVRYFAGIRSQETFRLTEADLKLDQDLIEVPAIKAKTRARRLVRILPNLKAWLDLGGELRPMSPYTVYKFKQLAKIPWPQNVTRHTFISNHVAHFKKVHETALEAGTSEQLVFSTYRALVTPQAAAEYWEIVPQQKAGQEESRPAAKPGAPG